MIGSHNSFTYLKSTNSVINAVSAFWRCQVKSIQEQYKAGVRFFDSRCEVLNVHGKWFFVFIKTKKFNKIIFIYEKYLRSFVFYSSSRQK